MEAKMVETAAIAGKAKAPAAQGQRPGKKQYKSFTEAEEARKKDLKIKEARANRIIQARTGTTTELPSHPYITKEVLLSTTPAQSIFQNAFNDCAGWLGTLTLLLPIAVINEADKKFVNAVLDRQINGGIAAIRAEVARIKAIAEDNGVAVEAIGYSNALLQPAKITCGKAGQFLQLISEFDKLVSNIHWAWFAGFISDGEKAALELDWRKKILRISREIQSISSMTFIPVLMVAFRKKYAVDEPVNDQKQAADKPSKDAVEQPVKKPQNAKKKTAVKEVAPPPVAASKAEVEAVEVEAAAAL